MAAVLRAKDCVMKTATTIQENAEDIYADAVAINEERAASEKHLRKVEACFEDEVEETTEETAAKRSKGRCSRCRVINYRSCETQRVCGRYRKVSVGRLAFC